MKNQSLLQVLAGLALALSSCDRQVPPPAPKPVAVSPAESPAATAAKSAFQKSLGELAVEMGAIRREADVTGNPLLLLKKLPEILEKARAVSTQDLPADLKTAYEEWLRTNEAHVAAIQTLPADFPSKVDDLPVYYEKNPAAAETFAAMNASMEQASDAATAAKAKLQTVAEKEKLDISKFLNGGQGE
ncbi:MAG: hypothetical protein EOP86_00320 [Verrucomicrobiaceae bacterium]|nr:MAG: hypothetical protein EOP86_00320 [Verrucomicrobiaceae bacterium]